MESRLKLIFTQAVGVVIALTGSFSSAIGRLFRHFKAFLLKSRLLTRRKLVKSPGSLVGRIQLLLFCWGAAVYLIVVCGFWFTSVYFMQKNFDQQANLLMDKLASLSAPLFVSNDREGFYRVESYFKRMPEVAYIKLYDQEGGSLLAEYEAESFRGQQAPMLNSGLFKHYSQQELLGGLVSHSTFGTEKKFERMIAPITLESVVTAHSAVAKPGDLQSDSVNVIGYIDMGLDFSSYQAFLIENIAKGSVVFLLFFLAAVMIGGNLAKNTLKPLLYLRDVLERLAKGDTTDVWVGETGDMEILAIGNALNSTITAIRGRDEALRRLADYDGLTGLLNKRSFNSILEQERQRVLIEREVSALFFIDLDQFKYINDTLGHAAGDRLLVQVAELLTSRMRSDDVVSRIGGDEFAILARAVDKRGAVEIAASIVKAMSDFLFIDQGKAFNIYCSAGVALIDSSKFSAEDIFSQADLACYSAKSKGRNRYEFYERKLIDVNKLDIGWFQRIADALANDTFVLHFQPIVSIDKFEIPGFEVLLRMIGQQDTLVPPNMFIPIAERLGLAKEIDYWVIKNSMNKLQALNREGQQVRFYINLSCQLMNDPDFIDRVVTMLGQFDIAAEQVIFELTERIAASNIHNTLRKMEKLRASGFEFSIGEFGTGFSSFSYLKNVPVEYVKIQGELIERITNDGVDRALVKSMIDVAKACGKKVVAEYVCDQQTYDLLKFYGINYMQGFFIARPSASPFNVNINSPFTENVAMIKQQ